MTLIVFPIVHQPSTGGSCDGEDSWCSESARREVEVGAAGVMERGGVAAAGQMAVEVFLGAVSKADVGVVSFLQAGAGEVRDGIDEEVMFTDAAEVHVAEGKKGLALTFRDEPTTAAGTGIAVAPNGSGLDKADIDVRSGVFLILELACEVGIRVSVGLDFFKAAAAAASEEVLVTGVVV